MGGLKESKLLCKTVSCIRVNGEMELEMDLESNCGQMALDMRDTGKMIMLVDKENQFMLMGIYMRDNG